MDIITSTIALFAFLFVYLLLGFVASRSTTSAKDFFLAGRNLGLIPVTFSLLATQIGSGMLLGTFDQAYQHGLLALAYPLGITIGFLFLGLGVAGKLRSLEVATTAEIFEKYYHSPRLKQLASVLSIATMCGLLIGQVVASRAVVDALSGGSILIFLIFWAIIITHTVQGGLASIAVSDTAQALFILFIFTGIFGYVWNTNPAICSLDGISDLQLATFPHTATTWTRFLPILIMPALFSLIEQDLAQRFFAARTKHIATVSALLSSGLLLLFACIPTYFGFKAHLLGVFKESASFPLFHFIETVVTQGAVLLVACAIIAAITSTADSLLCAVSSNIAQDFDHTFMRIKNPLTRSKIITLMAGCIAFGASFFVPQDIIAILIESYALSVCGLLVPLLAVYFGKPQGKYAAALSIAAGIGAFGICSFIFVSPVRELLPLAISLLGYLVGMMLTPKSTALAR